VRQTGTFGVLKLTLHPTTCDWQFIPVAGQTLSDSGTDTCHWAGIPVCAERAAQWKGEFRMASNRAISDV
jgi:hypothetical protein